MRVVYYFNHVIDDAVDALVAKVLAAYEEYELVYATGNRYSGLLARMSIPTPEKPTLIIINNGSLEGIWGLTHG